MRSRIIALAAGVSTVLALGAASVVMATSASAATYQCGSACFDLSNSMLGENYLQTTHGTAFGDQLHMALGSSGNVHQDFAYSFTGFVGGPVGACAVGLLPPQSKLCLDGFYQNDIVWQAVYAPGGFTTNKCVGAATNSSGAAFWGAKVKLEPCQSYSTLWVGDQVNSQTDSDGDNQMPWINGADPGFANPLVLAVKAGSRNPANGLVLHRENPQTGGVVASPKLFEVETGPYVGGN